MKNYKRKITRVGNFCKMYIIGIKWVAIISVLNLNSTFLHIRVNKVTIKLKLFNIYLFFKTLTYKYYFACIL